MFLKAAASIILSASFLLGAVPSFPVIDGEASFEAASFDNYDICLADGGTINIGAKRSYLCFDTNVNKEFTISLYKASDNRKVKSATFNDSFFDLEVESLMEEEELYYVFISYEAFGDTVTSGDHMIFCKGGNVYFWRSVNYDYNLDTTSEMWCDETSLNECLQPQNDVECDDPVIISYSNEICGDAATDWEKVYRIYTYISCAMAYDSVEAGDDAGAYQDSAIAVMRDGKGICEGFGNTFVALCRAQGIPAVVEFGIGFTGYDEITKRTPTNLDYADHAWAAVYLGGKWHFVDPTYDICNFYEGRNKISSYDPTNLYYLLPLEAFSNDHRIMDADTVHGIVSAGYCGDNATYEITRDGVCYISGEGSIRMPPGVNGFSKIVFDPDSNITVIESECFCDCDLITVVILPDSVKRIESLAFNTCEDLEYIYLPEGLEFIGQEAFECCDELCYVRVPDPCYTIEAWAFDVDPRLYLSVPSQFSDIDSNYDYKPMYIEYR